MPISRRPATSASLSLERFTALVDRQQHALDTFLQRLVGDAEEAADLLQDTFSEAWRATQEGRKPFVETSDEDQMRRWLFQVAYHKAIDILRRRRLLRWESLDLLSAQAGEPENTGPSMEEHVFAGEAL
jgi:DNA-directed RNA polymerase specialized sigma24 family protein